ncbi:hypothetical protein AAFF_G00441090 [Aldrovandia affinis]|uniref:Uncharacterized protein n=1 Tax=Aldrovandia affinis TaxID=143900 RepID=A0AAD7WHX6_9TELE|nr:hypothetical protein AAFF_G00441090 [Aldrovandia affinis]
MHSAARDTANIERGPVMDDSLSDSRVTSGSPRGHRRHAPCPLSRARSGRECRAPRCDPQEPSFPVAVVNRATIGVPSRRAVASRRGKALAHDAARLVRESPPL